MALCRITGTVQLPDGDNAAGRVIVFHRAPETVTAQSGVSVIPDSVPVRVAQDGTVDFELYTGNYVGVVRLQRQVTQVHFKFPVPEAATANFQDILQSVDPVEPLPSWLQEALDARDAAVQAAEDAEAAVGDGKLVSFAALNPTSGEVPYFTSATAMALRKVTTSSYDNTSGRIMKVSDFGLGGSAVQAGDVANDLNAVSGGGTQFVRAEFSTLNRPNRANNWLGLHIQRTSGIAVQLMVSRSSSPMLATRRVDTEVWTDWLYHYNSENILGTVAQAAGVPTGAIIERGSNANGEFTKWADGTMICWPTQWTPDLTGVTTTTPVSGVGTFPAAFSAVPLVLISANSNTTNGWSATADRGRGSVSIRGSQNSYTAILYADSLGFSGAQGAFNVMAIGRWF